MDNDKSPALPSGVLLPGLCVIALAIIGALRFQSPLRSARPNAGRAEGTPNPPASAGVNSFYSRLWDDPLATSYQNHQQNSATATGTLWPVFSFRDDSYRTSFGALLKSTKKLLCLPIMVSGAPYSDAGEDRTRTNYAVLCALKVSEYDLSFPTQMSYVELPITVQLDAVQSAAGTKTLIVPLKLFKRKHSDSEFALVLWIDEDQTGSRPLNVIAQVVTELFHNAPECWANIRVRVIGPSSSDGLRTVRQELWRSLDQKEPFALKLPLASFKDTTIFCGRATTPEPEIGDYRAPPGAPKIIRTIGDDRQLAAALIEELKLRGNWAKDRDNPENNVVVLLSERDTLYGETFPRGFQLMAGGSVTIKLYAYLRGIDGELPGQAQTSPRTPHSSGRQDHASDSEQSRSRTQTLTPTGRSQFDYLQRLQAQLVDYQNTEREAGRNGIVAIGIVGTDVYDKLLILRALRKSFPRAQFFTTDLDAEFADEAERDTARNLIIATHFGLQLNPILQQDVPPFRNSYQTAAYFSSLMALDNPLVRAAVSQFDNPWGYADNKRGFHEDPDSRFLAPLIHEIGLHGPYQLTIPGSADCPGSVNENVHPASPRQSPWLDWSRWGLVLLACVCVLLCLNSFFTSWRRVLGGTGVNFWGFLKQSFLRGLVAVLFLVVIPLAVIQFDNTRSSGEPFELFDGISLWGPVYIRYLTSILSLFFIGGVFRDLQRSSGALGGRYVGSARSSLWSEIWSLKWKDKWTSIWTGALVFNWFDIKPAYRDYVDARQPRPRCTEIYDDYSHRGEWPFRLLRAVPLSIGYMVFGYCLCVATDFPTNPYRGELAHVASSAVLYVGGFAMIILAFVVLDATQLCRRFVMALKLAEPDWKSAQVTRFFEERGARTPDEQADVRELLTIQIIGERTDVACKAIIYPFIIVFGFILARLPALAYLNLGWALLILWTLILAMDILSNLSVRRAAAETRDEILYRLRKAESVALGQSQPGSARLERLRLLIDEVTNTKTGALGPWYSNWVLRALSIPLGGGTGILLIQQFLPSLFI